MYITFLALFKFSLDNKKFTLLKFKAKIKILSWYYQIQTSTGIFAALKDILKRKKHTTIKEDLKELSFSHDFW